MATWSGKSEPSIKAKKCTNDKRYYWSAGDFQQTDIDKFTAKERKELFEYGVDTQCNRGEVCGTAQGKKCYICGFNIDQPGSNFKTAPRGSQCEHVLTVTTIAMLSGLSNMEYDRIIGDIATGNRFKPYNEFRNRMINIGLGPGKITEGGGEAGIVYKWSHPACNLIKNEYPFLGIINFTL